MKVVVIGAGHAGVAFVDAMRRNGFSGELTMIDRLAGLPLERPPLSKAFLLAEDGDEEGFALRAPGWFADSRITLLTGRPPPSPAMTRRVASLPGFGPISMM